MRLLLLAVALAVLTTSAAALAHPPGAVGGPAKKTGSISGKAAPRHR